MDAGVGPIAVRAETWTLRGAFLESLAANGVAPEAVTDVVSTHLHLDHVGWAAQDGMEVFPNATYRCHAHDWAHFFGSDSRSAPTLQAIAPRMEFWEGDESVLPGLSVMSAPGHTPGSSVVVLSSGSERALLLGDVVHCPVQLLNDESEPVNDVDPELARRTRIALARELEGTDVPMAGAHFEGMRFGRLLLAEGKRYWASPGARHL